MVEHAVRSTPFLDPVAELLNEVEEKMLLQANKRHPDLGTALDHLLASGGKRIRPAVALLCGGMLGAPSSELVTLSAAIELLHTATLVHDDLIDGSLLRRGIATLNAQWTPAATVLTGDFIFARAANLAAETGSVEVMQLFAETLAVIVNGEISQLFNKKSEISFNDYEQRIYAKTASLFELATVASALLSPVGVETVESMHEVGKNIGMAFQIVDDVLDFTGSTSAVGKPVGSDLRQGIITAPVLFYFNEVQSRGAFEPTINQDLSNEELDQIVTAVRESNAIEQSYRYAAQFVEKSRQQLEWFPEGIYKQSLLEISEFIVQRQT